MVSIKSDIIKLVENINVYIKNSNYRVYYWYKGDIRLIDSIKLYIPDYIISVNLNVLNHENIMEKYDIEIDVSNGDYSTVKDSIHVYEKVVIF